MRVFSFNKKRCRFKSGFFTRLIINDGNSKVLPFAKRRYMRNNISAQSCDSVPPAPALMLKKQFVLSSGSLSNSYFKSSDDSFEIIDLLL